MALKKYFLDVLKYKYADFNGRARRSEYWFFTLFKWIIFFIIASIASFGGENSLIDRVAFIIFVLVFIAFIVPTIAISIRRVHDSGKSGFLILLGIIPLIGPLILLIFYFLNSDPGPNKYGNNPHEIEDEFQDHLIH